MNTIQRLRKHFLKNEKGAAMALVLVFMAIATLVVPPALSYMSTGLKTGMMHEGRTWQLYAAESGINDGIWYARYDDFSTLFGSAYKEYDYFSSWNYNMAEPVNGYEVNVEIENVWLPSNITAPTELEARTIIEKGQLIITGSAPPETSTYRIRLSFYPDVQNDPRIETLGIWLPPGFSYVAGSSNLEEDPSDPFYPASVDVSSHAGGQAVIWSFWSVPIIDFGPEVESEGETITSTITFEYTSVEEDYRPSAVSWVTTSEAPDVPFTWDADTKIYHISSTAGDASIESYVGRSEIRELDSAMNGDYIAIGNTLMTATGAPEYRNRLFAESSAVVEGNDLPETATIQTAWLYWSGWIDELHETEIFYDSVSSDGQWDTVWEDDCTSLENWQSVWHDDCTTLGNWNTLWTDTCTDFGNWQEGSNWDIYNGAFRGDDSGAEPGDTPGTYPESTVTLDSGVIDLSSYGSGDVRIAWQQWEWGSCEEDDRLYYQFHGNGGWGNLIEAYRGNIGSTPQDMVVNIPDTYLTSDFRIRYFITEFRGSDEYCFIDNIVVSTRESGGWVAGSDWEASSGEFRGHHDGSEEDRYLTLGESIDLNAYTGEDVVLTWQQEESGDLESDDALRVSISSNGGETWSGMMLAFSNDNPSSPFTYELPGDYLTADFRLRFYLDDFSGYQEYAYIDNIDISVRQEGGWDSGSDWEVSSGQFRGHHDSSEEDRYLVLNEDIDLSAYQDRDVRIVWEQDESGELESDDALRYSISSDGGDTWSSMMLAFSNDNPPGTFTYELPGDYITSEFRIRFYLDNFSGGYEYAYIDDITVEAEQGNGWTLGDDWEIYNNEFHGHHDSGNEETDRYLQMTESIDLSAYQGTQVNISWEQDESGSLESGDSLKFSFSGNNGITWGSMITAFSNDDPPGSFSYMIPDGYLTAGFRVRYYLDGFSGSDEYAYIDNIRITQIDFGVSNVVFNGQEITADRQQVDENGYSGTYSYSCFYDATDLVDQLIENEQLEPNGSGTYTLGHVLRLREGDSGYSVDLYPSGTTGYPLGIPNTDTGWGQYAYAGWSLILIYTSPETEGHQLYLYDDFTFVGSGDTVNLPITGFLTPPDPTGSRLTCFAGEGDPFYTGDYVMLNDQFLSDAVNPANNIFNSYSNALDNPSLNGIDLDTFDISSYVQAGDTSADFETGSPTDIYNIVYVILSFRHDVTFGGMVSYLIRS